MRPFPARPRTRAEARRRRATVLFVLGTVGMTGLTVAAATADDTHYCYIGVDADGTWYGVNFDQSAGIPEGCTLAVWEDPEG